jgi:tetratricopeptide (TPR) repeat protein
MPRITGRTPLDAYRADIARTAARDSLGPHESYWLLVATGLHRLSQLHGDTQRQRAVAFAGALSGFLAAVRGESEPGAPLESADRLCGTLSRFGEPGLSEVLVTEILTLAADVEEAGALDLADTMLVDITLAVPDASSRARGLVLMQRGRIARTLGDLGEANRFYEAAREIGDREGVPELVVRGTLGSAVVARTRGNYPRARELFQEGLAGAERIGDRELVGIAHHGLLTAASAAGDIEGALFHAWRAFEGAYDDARRQHELLLVLGHFAAELGHHDAALRANLVVCDRASAPRLRLPALAGAALAAARLDATSTLERLTAEVEKYDAGTPSALFELGNALTALATAFAETGASTRADQYAARAKAIARKGGFFEIIHRLDQLRSQRTERSVPARSSLSQGTMDIVRELRGLPDRADLLASTGRSTG